MKKLFFTLMILGFAMSPVHAQWWTGSEKVNGNGNMTAQNRKVSEYEKVALEGSMDVELVAGKEGNLKVEAESNLMEYIVTEVSDGKLKISVENGINLSPSRGMTIKITVPFQSIDEVSLTGSGDIYTANRIESGDFRVQLTGSGDISLDLNCGSVNGTLTGSGDISLKGKTRKFDCRVTGSGDFEAFGLEAEVVNATVSGSGDLQVNPTDELRARITGSGDITYIGNPEKQDFRTAGSGAVSKR